MMGRNALPASVREEGRLIIDTGTIVQTPRAPKKTVAYPQGPSCITLEAVEEQ